MHTTPDVKSISSSILQLAEFLYTMLDFKSDRFCWLKHFQVGFFCSLILHDHRVVLQTEKQNDTHNEEECSFLLPYHDSRQTSEIKMFALKSLKSILIKRGMKCVIRWDVLSEWARSTEHAQSSVRKLSGAVSDILIASKVHELATGTELVTGTRRTRSLLTFLKQLINKEGKHNN